MVSAPAQQNYAALRSWLAGASVEKLSGALPEASDGGKPATEGARSAENSADVKRLIPVGSVDGGKNNPHDGKSDNPVPDSGLAQTTVGKMPEVERAVKTVTEENEKIAARVSASASDLNQDIASLEKIASAMQLIITASAVNTANIAATPTTMTPGGKTAAETPNSAPASIAQDAERLALISDHIKFGSDRGVQVGEYLRGYTETYAMLAKAAEDGSLANMLAQVPPDDAAAAGGDPGAGGGAPPDAAPMPDAPASPAPGGDMGGAGGGMPSVDDLAAALAEMGVSPDEVMQAAQKMQGETAAAPESADKTAAVRYFTDTIKMATDAKTQMRAGNFRLKPAADGSPERKRRDTAREYVAELFRFAQR